MTRQVVTGASPGKRLLQRLAIGAICAVAVLAAAPAPASAFNVITRVSLSTTRVYQQDSVSGRLDYCPNSWSTHTLTWNIKVQSSGVQVYSITYRVVNQNPSGDITIGAKQFSNGRSVGSWYDVVYGYPQTRTYTVNTFLPWSSSRVVYFQVQVNVGSYCGGWVTQRFWLEKGF